MYGGIAHFNEPDTICYQEFPKFRFKESPCLSRNLAALLKYMKLKSLVGRSLVGVACMSFMLGTAARASDKSEYKIKNKNSAQVSSTVVKPKEQVILVYMTGSRIPQRVVDSSTYVNGASNLRVFGRNDLIRSGSATVSGMLLSIDPDITLRHH